MMNKPKYTKKMQSQNVVRTESNPIYNNKMTPNKKINNVNVKKSNTLPSKNPKTKNFMMGSQHQVFNSLQTAIERSKKGTDCSKESHQQRPFKSNKSDRELSSSSGSRDLVIKKLNYSTSVDENKTYIKSGQSETRDKSAGRVPSSNNGRPLSTAWSFTSEAMSDVQQKVPFR